MKKQIIGIILGASVLFLIIYMVGQGQTPDHATLSDSAILPDKYLRNVEYYEDRDRHDVSAFNIERAIKSIWKLENDVDDESFERLENSINMLEQVRKHILRDSIDTKQLRSAFEYALNNLAHTELEVAEMYAETNHLDQSGIALKYAKIHIKNAMLFHNPYWDSNDQKLAIEKQVFLEIDSLLNVEAVSPVDYTLALDKMIKEIDEIIDEGE